MIRPKLAIICSTDYKTYPMGGMMSFIVDLLPYLNKYFTITLVGVKTDTHINETDFIELSGKKYPFKIFSNVITGKRRIPNILRVVSNLWKNKNSILQDDFDILYIHGIPLSFPLFKSVKIHSQSPMIVNHVHGLTNPFAVSGEKSLFRQISTRLYTRYRKWVVRKSDLILLASDMSGHKEFSSDYPPTISEHIKYVPNFADCNVFKQRDKQEARKQLGISQSIKIFINTGRLSHQKDPVLSIEAFANSRLYEKENAHLYIIGDGELALQLLDLVKKRNLEEHVHLLGRLERTDIAIWLSAADVYIYTSHGNGFPIALVEAGMCGLPIVTTDVAGVHDIVIDGTTGFLVENRDPEVFALYMNKALEKNHILGNNIIVQSKRFTPEKIAQDISKMLMSTLESDQ